MLKIIAIFSILVLDLLSLEILNPDSFYKASSNVTTISVDNNKIYIGTDSSIIDIIDLKSKKKIAQIKLDKIKDFLGDMVDVKVFNIDILNKNILSVSQSNGGKSDIFIFDSSLNKIFSFNNNLAIINAKFINKNQIVFCTIDNILYLLDIKTKKILKQTDVRAVDDEFNSKFSDMTLNDKKDKIAIADESGDLKIIDLNSFKIEKILKSMNLDNVFKLIWKKDTIITAGQDRRAVVYDLLNNKSYYKKSDFLIYSCSLDDSANLGAYSSDEENNVIVFDIKNNTNRYKLIKNSATVNTIIFLNNNEILIANDSAIINLYKTKGK